MAKDPQNGGEACLQSDDTRPTRDTGLAARLAANLPRRREILRGSAAFASLVTCSAIYSSAETAIGQIGRSADSYMGGILFYGQSNAGNGGTKPATFETAQFPRTNVTFASPGPQFGGKPVDPSRVFGTAPLRNIPASPLASIVPMSVALEQFIMDSGESGSVPRFFHTTWVGARPISAFAKGTSAYSNLLLSAKKFVNEIGSFGFLKRLDAVVWIQGESFEANYAAILTRLVHDLFSELKVEVGQDIDPKILIFQINNNMAYNNFDQTPLDQFLVGTTVANAVLVGPMYYTPLEVIPGHPDRGIHGTEIGRMMLGEAAALACKALFVDRTGWNALVPIRINRSGKVITVRFALPPGGERLAWDTEWIGATPHYGFYYSDHASSAAISSVILGDDGRTVQVTLNRDPTGGNRQISYAIGPGDHTVCPPWPAVRGQLISPTRQQSAFYRLGYPLPRYLNHYAVRFRMPVE